jgi:DNA-directed RNA polymerase subunit omega
MKAELLTAANQIIPSQQILVNVISRRVRQLIAGHRPLVEVAPGLGFADIALTEVSKGKLTYESTFVGKDTLPQVVQFPGTGTSKKKAA